MKFRIPRLAAVMTIVSMIFSAHLAVRGQDSPVPGQNPHSFVGTWIVELQITNCFGTVIDNHGKLLSINSGGTTTETSGSTFLRSTSLGVWRHERLREFVYAQRFFRFNPDGTRAGGVQAIWNVTMGEDGDTYTATGAIQLTLPNGSIAANLCGIEAATRMTIPE